MSDEIEEMRRFFVDAIGGYSEERYCAGWMSGIEDEVRKKGGSWTVLAYLANGWPRLSDRPRWVKNDNDDVVHRTYHDWHSLMDWEPLTAAEITAAKRHIGIAILHEQTEDIARREATGDDYE